jgi:quinoprotein glucose dehydrogenase
MRMSKMSKPAVVIAGALWGAFTLAAGNPRALQSAPPTVDAGEWPSYAGDLRGQHYSPLDQVNGRNFDTLEVAWRFKTDALGSRPEFKLEGTPLVVKGMMYATAGTRRAVVALDAATGELRWVHSEQEGARSAAAPRQLSGRGLAYWTDGTVERILYVTIGFRLVALDAKTGAPVQSFGKDGIIDLKEAAVFGNRQPIDPIAGEIGVHSTPAVTRSGIVIIGSSFREGGTPNSAATSRVRPAIMAGSPRPRSWSFGSNQFQQEDWLALRVWAG